MGITNMLNKLIEIIETNIQLILAIGTIIILLINYVIKKIKRRIKIKMKRTHEYYLNDQEAVIIDNYRKEQKAIMLKQEEKELNEIIKTITPEMLTTFNEIKNKLIKLKKNEDKYNYGDEINETLSNLKINEREDNGNE